MLFGKIKGLGQNQSHKLNFGLSESRFSELVHALEQANEELLYHIHENHMKYCVSFLIMKGKADRDLAYDIYMNTLVEFREKILQGKIKYGNLKFLFNRMARNNLVDQYKKKQKISESIHMFLDLKNEQFDPEQLLSILSASIHELDPDEGKLIHDIFLMQKDMRALAREYNISYDNIRKRKERALKSLKNKFLKKIKEI